MAEKYWMTFRIAEVGNRKARYDRLIAAVFEIAEQRHWKEPTSFFAFTAGDNIDTVADHLKGAIDTTCDLVLLAKIGYKSYRIFGHFEDDDVFLFFPELQKS